MDSVITSVAAMGGAILVAAVVAAFVVGVVVRWLAGLWWRLKRRSRARADTR